MLVGGVQIKLVPAACGSAVVLVVRVSLHRRLRSTADDLHDKNKAAVEELFSFLGIRTKQLVAVPYNI